MACYNHPDKEAVATCSVCGRPICSDCYVEIGGNPYCKNCLNALINANATEKAAQKQPQAIENIKPITKPKTIPYEEPVEEVAAEAPKEIVTPVEKAPENYEPDYDYQTEYVETYGDGDSEDSYYENPESIPEPEPEYKKKMVADPIIPIKPKEEVYAEETPTVQNHNNIESKYERYLEDLYYDEEPKYNTPPRNNQYYEEPIYVDRQNYVNEPIYPERYADDDLDYIVPIHHTGPRDNGPSYEEIKRRLEAERNYNQGYGDYYPENEYGYGRSRGRRQNLEEIQRMHSYEQQTEDDSFTALELLLTIILIILIIVVVFYIIYLFALSSEYATFIEAVKGLVQNPGLFFNNLIHQ